MKVFRVRPDSKGKPRPYRWVLYADFDRKLGLIPVCGGDENEPWTEALVAVDELGVAAVLRYDKTDAELLAGGTWVRLDRRGQGLAGTLWRSALRGVTRVQVTTVSAGGRGLVRRLKAQFPKVGWSHTK